MEGKKELPTNIHVEKKWYVLSKTDEFADKRTTLGHGLFINEFHRHCVKSFRIRSFSGPYSVRMWENMDQKHSEYGHFSRFEKHCESVNSSKSFRNKIQ